MRKKFILLIITLILIILFFPYFIVNKYGINIDTYEMRQKINSIKDDMKKISFGKKKIIIVTLETRKIELLEYHNKNIKDYSIKHDYSYLFFDKYENKLKLPIYWTKIQLVLEILENNNVDYVMWIDSDTIICEPEINLEYIINQCPEKSIFIGLDYPATDRYNAGVFLIKNNDIGKNFLKECIKVYTTRDKCIQKINGKIEYKLNGGWSGECYEQGVMNELLFTTYKNECCSIDQHLLLNIGIPISDTFILHLHSGLSKNKDEISNYFKKIINGERINISFIDQFMFLVSKFFSKFDLSYQSVINYFRFNRGHYNDLTKSKMLLKDQNHYPSEIPLLLFQTYKDKDKIPDEVYENIDKFASEYKHIILDDKDSEEFFSIYFEPIVLQTFKEMKLGAHKADLLRYCLLYIYGGVYMDIHKELLVPLSEIVTLKNAIYSIFTHTRDHISQGFISTPSRHPLFLSLIQYIVDTGNPTYYHDFCKDFLYQVEVDMNEKVTFDLQKSKTGQEYYLLIEKCSSTDGSMCGDKLDK